MKKINDAKLRILIIENEETEARLYQKYIQKYYPYAVITIVHTGASGLAFIATIPFDLIFVDLVMVPLSGIDITRKIHALKLNIPIVGLTDFEADKALQESSQQAGMVFTIEKKALKDKDFFYHLTEKNIKKEVGKYE